jgi:hypothetical protein
MVIANFLRWHKEQKSEVRRQKSENRCHRIDDRRRMTETSDKLKSVFCSLSSDL